jgi:hypothetical protein
VPEFAGDSGRATVEATIKHEARADSGSDLDVDQVPCPPAGAVREFAEGPQVRVVVDFDPQVKPPLHLDLRVEAGPSRQDRRGADEAARLVNRARKSQSDPEHIALVDRNLGKNLGHKLGRGVESGRGRAVHIESDGPLGEQARRKI